MQRNLEKAVRVLRSAYQTVFPGEAVEAWAESLRPLW